MELETSMADLQSKLREHRKNSCDRRGSQDYFGPAVREALGYDIFNPSEVKGGAEFTCDVGTKKGEKVDYALCVGGEVTVLVECKPVTSELNIKHASQLLPVFRRHERAGRVADERCRLSVLHRLRADEHDGREAVLHVQSGKFPQGRHQASGHF